jgi:hypothetical protein
MTLSLLLYHVELDEVLIHVSKRRFLFDFKKKKIKKNIKLMLTLIYIPAVCCGLIPIPSLVIMALVAEGTLN